MSVTLLAASSILCSPFQYPTTYIQPCIKSKQTLLLFILKVCDTNFSFFHPLKKHFRSVWRDLKNLICILFTILHSYIPDHSAEYLPSRVLVSLLHRLVPMKCNFQRAYIYITPDEGTGTGFIL